MNIAAVELPAGDDIGQNVERALGYIAEASRQGAALVALPEYFAWYGPEDEWSNVAEEGEAIAAKIGAAALAHDIFVVAGSILFPGGEGRARNESLLFGPDGSEIVRYTKIHLFDVETPERSYCESDFLEPGDQAIVARIGEWEIGLSLCFDLRFPDYYVTLRSMGAHLMAVPAAFTYETGKDHWEVLLRARAIETQSYVIAPALSGETSDGKKLWGHATIVDPWGAPVAFSSGGEGIIYADLDLRKLLSIRENMPLGFDEESENHHHHDH